MDCKVKVLKKHPDAQLPKFAFEDDGAADIYSIQDIEIYPNTTEIVDTGISLEIPEGWEAHILSRSGLAAKNSLFVLNAPGIIDAGYRGNIKIIMHNLNSDTYEPFHIKKGDRIAQIAVRPVPKIKFELAESLEPSKRGQGGLGSTGVK